MKVREGPAKSVPVGSPPAGRPPSLYRRIAGAPDCARLAVVSADGSLTYAALLAAAESLASQLSDSKGPLLIYGHKQPAMLVGFVAALRLGRAYVPVDPVVPPARVARMLALARPGQALLAEEPPADLGAALAADGIPTILLGPLAERLTVGPSAQLPSPPDRDRPDDPAYILFTSGTTGDPKGVAVPYGALTHFADWLLDSQALVPGRETFLNQAPFNFDLSVMDLYGALLTGGTLFCVNRAEVADPRALFARLAGAPLTTWVSTPSFARFCLAEPRFRQALLPTLRRFLFCGEVLPPGVVRELQQRFPDAVVWNTYGPTETTVAVAGLALSPERAASEAPLPVGWPFPGLDVWVAEPANPGHRLADGQIGEITIAGPQVALGYLGMPARPDAAAGPFFRLPDGRRAYRTGDLGYIDPRDGLLYCEGRQDRQIKLHGYRLELDEIEACLRMVPGVSDAAVLSAPPGGQPEYLIAYVVADSDDGPALPGDPFELTEQVRAELSQRLPAYALPRFVRRLSALPLNSNGKLDRQRLAELGR